MLDHIWHLWDQNHHLLPAKKLGEMLEISGKFERKKSTFGRGEAGAFVTDFKIKITDQIHN